MRSVRSSLLIIVIAALLVEVVSFFQYSHLQKMVQEELGTRSRIELRSKSALVTNTLGRTEATMREHLWEVQRYLPYPDSMFAVTRRLIDTDPYIVGACIAFIPHYYPKKGRLFEPYAYEVGDTILVEQIGSANHDYSLNPIFREVLELRKPIWSDPYDYGKDSMATKLTTYSYPVKDRSGQVVAICGLDIDLSWLGDTLNARQFHPSTFEIMLTEEGNIVAGPSGGVDRTEVIDQVVSLIRDSTTVRSRAGNGSTTVIKFRDKDRRQAYIHYRTLSEEPRWQVAQVCYHDEIYAPMRKLRLRQMFLILAGLLVLSFMILRFAGNEKKLRLANMEQARIGSELAIARNIQMHMIPKEFPDREDVDIFGSLVPAREVGGDIFDFFIRDGKLFFCIGDVSGKGVPSAMVMSVVHSLFRMVSDREETPSRIVQTLNEQICRENESNIFITFFLGVLDLDSGLLRYCNAGHDRPLLVGDDVTELSAKAHLPLGVFDDTVFGDEECFVHSGSAVFLFTDGLTEAKNARRRPFGRQRVESALACCKKASSAEMIACVSEEVHGFVEDAEQSDDLTMLCIRYSGPETMKITLRNSISELARMNEFVKSFTGRFSLDKKTATSIRLALEELVVNVISYAYPEEAEGKITVEACTDQNGIKFIITDEGVPFDPTSAPPADPSLGLEDRPTGGLGIFLANQLMDRIHYERRDNQNILTLNKSIV